MKLSKRFPLNALRVFEAVARHKSFTRAAEELGMTQTAVSYQIKLLEETIGTPLFLRRPRQIVATAAAERMLPDLAKAFELMSEAVASARQASNETLEVHSSPTFGSHWLARNLGAFQLEHPSIAVRLLRVSKLTDFSRDAADVGIRWGVGPWPEVECHLLGQFAFAPMLSPALIEANDISRPEDLLKLPIIGAQQEAWPLWFEQAGVGRPDLSGHTRYRYIEQDLCANAALAGQGVAMLNHLYYADELAAGRLVAPFPEARTDDVGVWLVYPPNRRNAPKIKAFREWILAAVAADMQRTEPPQPSRSNT